MHIAVESPPLARRRVDSPLGPIIVVAAADGLREIRFEHVPRSAPLPRASPDAEYHAAAAAAQLAEYFARTRRNFTIPLAPRATPFQNRVWSALRTIPYGRTCSYADIACLLGEPRSARAVGLANAANPIAIVIPCHRVIGADGSLHGYAGGVHIKAWLLMHERNEG